MAVLLSKSHIEVILVMRIERTPAFDSGIISLIQHQIDCNFSAFRGIEFQSIKQ